jgi:transcriptional regulator with XRE-family HTH domain
MEVTVTDEEAPIVRIPESELAAYRAEIKGEIFRDIRHVMHEKQQNGFTQKQLAQRLGVDEGLLSRRLKGENDLQLETLADLARGLDCKLEVEVVPLSHPKFARAAPRASAADVVKRAAELAKDPTSATPADVRRMASRILNEEKNTPKPNQTVPKPRSARQKALNTNDRY